MENFIIHSLREHPEELERFISYFSANWGNPEIYRDCMTSALTAAGPLPQWYLAFTPDHSVSGGAGLIPNDFISRMDLTPWLCALRIEPSFRGARLGFRLIEHLASESLRLGYTDLFCCTDLIGYYEKSGFEFIGFGHHPWGETSRIYRKHLSPQSHSA